MIAWFGMILMIGAAPAAAEDIASENTLHEVMNRLHEVKSASGKFTEKKFLRILNAPLESSGMLVYIAPDRLEKNTTWPDAQSLIVIGDDLTIARETDQPRTLKLAEHPEIEAFVESVRATLAGNIDGLRRFYDVALDGDVSYWTLSLRPTVKAMGDMIKTITLSGRDGLLESVEIDESDGDRSVMTVTPISP